MNILEVSGVVPVAVTHPSQYARDSKHTMHNIKHEKRMEGYLAFGKAPPPFIYSAGTLGSHKDKSRHNGLHGMVVGPPL